jgi:hypothetical protein
MFSIIGPASPVLVHDDASRAPTETLKTADLVGSATDVAVMVVVPFETAVTTPLLTVAMFGAALDHVTAVETPGSPDTVATTVDVLPAVNVNAVGDSETLTG